MREHGLRHAHAGSDERGCVLRRSTGPQLCPNPVLRLVAGQPPEAMTLPICQAVRSAIAVCFAGLGAEDIRAPDSCVLDVESAQFAGQIACSIVYNDITRCVRVTWSSNLCGLEIRTATNKTLWLEIVDFNLVGTYQSVRSGSGRPCCRKSQHLIRRIDALRKTLVETTPSTGHRRRFSYLFAMR
jgi:hypothetical protein